MIDTRRLLVLREVAAHGSVSGAADALGYTPSAVSQQLGALERETGRSLVERHGRGIRLTDAARLLLPHAHDVLAALERVDAALAASAAELHGSVRLASFPTATRALLPSALAGLRARHPGLRVDLTELEPHESLPALALGRIDVAVAHEYDLVARDAARDLRRADLLTEPVLLAERDASVDAAAAAPAALAGHAAAAPPPPAEHVAAAPAPLAGHEPDATAAPARLASPARLADYAERDWILPPATTACGELVRRACRAAGFEPRAVAVTGDFSVACALAAAGVGVALVPRLGAHPLPGLTLRSLTPALERRIFVAARSGSDDHPLIRAVLAAIAG